MILIADSGATKTDWVFGDSVTGSQPIHTQGINPFHLTEQEIRLIIFEQLVGQLPFSPENISHIFFYGAGCTPEKSAGILRSLNDLFPSCHAIEVQSDLLGAARALCKNQKGIACILGTGSNSCLYDGEKILDNIPPLGYILGDEGSGACLGKRFISDCMKRQLPPELLEGLLAEFNLTPSLLLDRIYREPLANRFLAGFTPYIYKYRKNIQVHHFLIRCFDDFFKRNVYLYGKEWPVSFTGSVAWFFQEEINESAGKSGFTTSLYLKNPIQELARYHFKNI